MQISPFFRLTSSPCDIDYTRKRISQIRVHMRELWLFKLCQKLLSCCQKQNFSKSGKCAENGFDQFLELHNLCYTYPNQLILEPKLKRKMRRRHRKKNQPIWMLYTTCAKGWSRLKTHLGHNCQLHELLVTFTVMKHFDL